MDAVIFLSLLILLVVSGVNTFFLVTISATLMKMVAPRRPKMMSPRPNPQPGLVDLPMKQTDYGDMVANRPTPTELWLLKDE